MIQSFVRIAAVAALLCAPAAAYLHAPRMSTTLPPAEQGARAGEKEAAALRASIAPEPLVICGPSGVGKGTLIARLMGKYGSHFGFSTSHTTRSPRPGEENGQHYFFVSRGDFQEQVAQGRFIEHAEVHGNLYGTSVAAVEIVRSARRICILDIDTQGVQHLKENLERLPFRPKFIFIAPPSIDTLRERLGARGTESDEQVRTRLSVASREVDYGTSAGVFDRIIVNDDLERALADLESAIADLYPAVDLVEAEH